MQCKTCVHWVMEELTYIQFRERWDEVISSAITPGHEKRYKKKSRQTVTPFDQVVIRYKYCASGRLNRLYICKSKEDNKPVNKETNCPSFTTSTSAIKEFPIPSPLWSYCITESYSPPAIKGLEFVQGLYERGCFKIPVHGEISPQVVASTRCSICGKRSDNGIEVQKLKQFCCNRHYLQWWAGKHPELYRKWQKTTSPQGHFS